MPPKKVPFVFVRKTPTAKASIYDVGYEACGTDGHNYIIIIDTKGFKRWKKVISDITPHPLKEEKLNVLDDEEEEKPKKPSKKKTDEEEEKPKKPSKKKTDKEEKPKKPSKKKTDEEEKPKKPSKKKTDEEEEKPKKPSEKKVKSKDPTTELPNKKPLSAYNFYVKEQTAKFEADKVTERKNKLTLTEAAVKWKELNEKDKKYYRDLADEDKDRKSNLV